MPSQPLDRNHAPAPTNDSLDRRLTRVLEAAPHPQVPHDFAERLTARLPPRTPASIPVTHYGRTAILIGILVVLAAMLALAPHTAGRGIFQLAMEWTLLVFFLGLTVWFTGWHTHAN